MNRMYFITLSKNQFPCKSMTIPNSKSQISFDKSSKFNLKTAAMTLSTGVSVFCLVHGFALTHHTMPTIDRFDGKLEQFLVVCQNERRKNNRSLDTIQ